MWILLEISQLSGNNTTDLGKTKIIKSRYNFRGKHRVLTMSPFSFGHPRNRLHTLRFNYDVGLICHT